MKQWCSRFLTGNYNILLILLFLLFVFRPYTADEVYIETWKSFLIIALIVAIFNCSHKKSTKIFISILAVPTFILSWLNLFDQTMESLIATAIMTAFYMAICAGSIVYDVLVRARVTLETLRGVICAYFLAAFIFAYIYILIEYLSPTSPSITAAVWLHSFTATMSPNPMVRRVVKLK